MWARRLSRRALALGATVLVLIAGAVTLLIVHLQDQVGEIRNLPG